MTSNPVGVRSLITVDNERRQSGFRLGAPPSRRRTRPPSTLSSVAIARVPSRGEDKPSSTIVATCLRDEKSRSASLGGDAPGSGAGGGRLSVALVGPDNRAKMRYSAPGRNFSTVGIVPSPSDCGCVNLLAVGDNGRLWTGPVDIDPDRRTGFELRLHECQYRESRTSDSPRKKAKHEVPDWTCVDAFIPMLEREDVVSMSSQACSPGRQANQSHRAFVLATRLNTRCPPTLMELTFCTKSNSYCNSWLPMSGLEDHAKMTCAFFASKERCGARIWAKLTSSMGHSMDGQRGIALLGFEDGSLMASIVTATDESDSPKVTRAIRLFKLTTAEPLLSIQILEMGHQHEGEGTTEQVLLCTGALGNILSLKSNGADCFEFETTLPSCKGRWTSLTCVGLHAVVGDRGNVSFVGSNDSRGVFACSVTLQQISKGDQQEYHQEINQLPSPPRIASVHGPQSCLAIEMDSPMYFVSARVDGRVCLAELSRSSDHVSHGTIASLHPTLRETRKITSSGPDVVIPNSTPNQDIDGQLVCEVREATRIASRITENTLTVSMTECDGGGTFSYSMLTNNLDHENQALNWVTTRHLLQPSCAISRAIPRSIKEARPICYRRTCDGMPVKVVFGGTASSYANAETNSSQVDAVPADANPMNAFSSMSLIYSDSMRWFRSEAITKSAESSSSSKACRSSEEVVVGVSLTHGSRTLDLLSGVSNGQTSQSPRVDAEGLINMWFQSNSTVSKEDLWLDKRHVAHNMFHETAHCFSDSIDLINVPKSLQSAYSCRFFRGVGPVAVVSRQEQDGVTSIDFAHGSMGSIPSKLPHLRRAILSRVLLDSKNMTNKDISRKLDLFYTQISQSNTSKLLKYISRQADSLMARLESSDNSCPDELERASMLLYDTLRANLKLTF